VPSFEGRLGIVQRVLPRYRAPFFDILAGHCSAGLHVFAGAARPSENIPLAESLSVATWTRANNMHLFAGPLYLCLQPGLRQWLEESQPDALIVEANTRYLSTPGAVGWMKEQKRPVLGWGLGSPKLRGPLAGLRLQRRRAFLVRFDALIAYSQRGAEEYAALGIPTRRIFVAPNAVSLRPAGDAPKRPSQFEGRPKVLYVGRLQARKRLDALIRACAALPKNILPQLTLVGDGPERLALQQLAGSLLPNTVFTGTLFGTELDAMFDSADLFVLPGTGGLAIQQAMGHALPVIAAEGDGSQHDMVTPANGWLLQPNDDAALQAALATALSDAGRLRAMGAESFRLVQQKFNLEAMVDAFIAALNTVKA
jgi:glycosyltransferase involved in cell wall biosynthesis